MSKLSRCLSFVILSTVFLMFGCAGVSTVTSTTPPATTPPVTPPPPAASYQIVTISDLHFNPLYDPSLFSQLVAATPSQWGGIYQTSGVAYPSAGGTDTNYLLLMATLTSMKKNMGNSPVILFTGDLLGHNIQKNYCTIYLTAHSSLVNNATLANCIATQSTAIQAFINNTFSFVALEIQTVLKSTPVIYAPGNIDTYEQNLGPNLNEWDLGPDTAFLQNNEATVWNQFLQQQADPTFTNTFPTGGYYFFQYVPKNSKTSPLRIVVLNSNSFVAGSPTYSNASTELTWLGQQLQAAQKAGQEVWILMHVPPGENSQWIAQVAPLPQDVPDVESNPEFMMWDPTVQWTPTTPSFLQTLQQYPGVVTLMLAGHTHMDEYRILAPGYVVEQLPGISPCFGNNPAYKILTVTQNTFTPTDYQSFDLNQSYPLQFDALYQFSTTYGAQSTLGSSLEVLYPKLNSIQSTQDMYTFLYSSGNNGVNPSTQQPWNPINGANWPIFGCTIGQETQAGYLTCVDPSQ